MAPSSASATGFLSDVERKACQPIAALPAIDSLENLVAAINALPRPTPLHCLIANLPRPLAVQAGNSVASAQPSGGPEDPRIFVKVKNIILGIVPDGVAKNTLEVGEVLTGDQAIRAEFVFPVTIETLSARAGLDHIKFGGGTTCGLCHKDEKAADTLAGSTTYQSNVLRFAAIERVPVELLRQQANACRSRSDSTDRCLVYKALFEGGAVTSTEF